MMMNICGILELKGDKYKT